MDLAITNYFRVIVDDFNRLLDVWHVYYRMKKDSGEISVRGFTEALQEVVDAESEMDYRYDKAEKSQKWVDEGEKKNWASGELADFIHTVIIQFTIDELTQFPFWFSKVSLCFGPESSAFQKEFSGAFALYKYAWHKIRAGGLISLYSGCIPYITSVFIYQFAEFRIKISRAIKALIIKLPRSASSPYLQANSKNEANNSLVSPGEKKSLVKRSMKSVSSLTNITQLNEDYNNENSLNNGFNAGTGAGFSSNSGFEKKKTQELSWSEKITQKSLITIAGHPCLALGVNMVVRSQANWMSAAWSLLRDHGILSLFRGLRSNLGFRLSTVNPFYLLGLREYFIYNSILSPESKGGILSFFRSMLTSSIADVRSGRSNVTEIATKLFRYAYLTFSSVIPSFLLFVGCRGVLGMILPHTKLRRAQIKTRKEILFKYYYNKSSKDNDILTTDTFDDTRQSGVNFDREP